MNEQQVQELYLRFAAPLASFVRLGTDVEATEQLARNLWTAMVAGPEAEQQMWDQLQASRSELVDVLRICYDEQMRPVVDEATWQKLQDWYRRQHDRWDEERPGSP